jgi:2-succinyl-5-enolpyruvyl-6-hydroxy-3-cyclohexene-1-carboxylate synthase
VTTNLHIAWAKLFMRALATSGVRDVVVSPGSRSTPLVVAAAEEEAITCHVVVDERSAGFFALGQGRATGRPTALLCTSGTAAAHYYPAILEASAAFIPLVVVTADRPWEAYDAASPQTIDQAKMFGASVRHYAELGLPDAAPAAMSAVVRVAAQAVAGSMGPQPGPVHVNARFRKPLEPVSVDRAEPWQADWERLMAKGAPRVYSAHSSPDARTVDALVSLCASSPRGLIVCGPAEGAVDGAERRDAVVSLAKATGYPVLAEATSSVRFGGDGRGAVIVGAFDAVLRDAKSRVALADLDLVIELGRPPTSAAYASWLGEHPPARRAVLSAHGWNDPAATASDFFACEPSSLARAAAERLSPHEASRALAAAWAVRERAVVGVVREEIASGMFTEGRVAHDVVAALPAGSSLLLSNSTPVRDVDLYASPSSRGLHVLHQRGASGIDGMLSGAAGARGATSGPLLLLAGDLAFLHDIGGLAVLRKAKGPLVVVVVDNDGGRIFEQLPVSRAVKPETLSRFFVTREPIDTRGACAAFGVRAAVVTTPAELDASLREGLSMSEPLVIVAKVDARSRERRARIWAEWAPRIS